MFTIGNLLVLAGSVVIALGGLVLVAKGTSRTQAILRQADEKDLIIDTMAWVDRKVFRAEPLQTKSPATKRELVD